MLKTIRIMPFTLYETIPNFLLLDRRPKPQRVNQRKARKKKRSDNRRRQ